jgi:hypothetical protein
MAMRKHAWFWILILVGTMLLGLRCGEKSSTEVEIPTLTIDTESLDLEVSSWHDFNVTYEGNQIEAVWYVDGAEGGDPYKGMITVQGLYVAPDAEPPGGTVSVRAVALADTSLWATAAVRVTRTAQSSVITVTPKAATVVVGDSVTFSASGCGSGNVIWSSELVSGYHTFPGEIKANGTYLAPASNGALFEILIKAASPDCPDDKIGIAKVIVPAAAQPFTVEAENYEISGAFHNIPGSDPIVVDVCSNASGRHAVQGVDAAGDYIDIGFTPQATGAYSAAVRYAAWENHVVVVRVTVMACNGEPQSEDFTLDQGSGTGG